MTAPRSLPPPLRTPLLAHPGGLFLKAENLQRGGSYKARGVHEFLSSEAASFGQGASTVYSGGLSTVSAGNLGRAFAEACARLALPCRVYVPDSAPEAKKEKIRAHGAALVEKPFAEIFRLVQEPPRERGFLHPLLTPALLNGYGRIAREVLEDLPACGVILVPFGLGGLALAVARELKERGSRARVIAAELDACAPYSAALAAGRPVTVEKTPTFVDAIGTPTVLPYVFEEARALFPESIAVSLAETRAALRELLLFHGLRVEGAAAVALAAAKRFRAANPRLPAVALLSGGNIDERVFLEEAQGAGAAAETARLPPETAAPATSR